MVFAYYVYRYTPTCHVVLVPRSDALCARPPSTKYAVIKAFLRDYAVTFGQHMPHMDATYLYGGSQEVCTIPSVMTRGTKRVFITSSRT